MSSLKDSERKRGILTGSGRSKEALERTSEMPTNPRAGRRSLYLKVGTDAGRQKAGQTVLAQQLVKRMRW